MGRVGSGGSDVLPDRTSRLGARVRAPGPRPRRSGPCSADRPERGRGPTRERCLVPDGRAPDEPGEAEPPRAFGWAGATAGRRASIAGVAASSAAVEPGALVPEVGGGFGWLPRAVL